ncbi:DUF3575 domain-containing protein [Flavobacterium restrictum]|uniref:DUF3575 domain-containing protein n=1 Tax=Flavobacterium restrictum TaxID=2594428 RepID=A0A553E581_9FLAO|nr:DUF3575 domain-containing protein [Flavobacterium restrictum]TRX40122.1 DUF3575 domain-containing protein [Flavobacterium restrictum]
MKKLVLVVVFFSSIASFGQTYIKGNALTALILMPNFGVETSIGKKTTFQFDILAFPWKSINGKPRQFYTFTNEVRYHFNEKYNGFYAGGNAGMSKFNFQKWNYLDLGKYQKGFGYFFGATIGYEKKWNDKFIIDYFVGGGWHQGFYHGYELSTGIRSDHATNWNKSGEWLPFRGGIMISYKLD